MDERRYIRQLILSPPSPEIYWSHYGTLALIRVQLKHPRHKYGASAFHLLKHARMHVQQFLAFGRHSRKICVQHEAP